MSEVDVAALRDRAWENTIAVTATSWALLEHLEPEDKQLVTGLAQECFGQGYEAGYEAGTRFNEAEHSALRERLARQERNVLQAEAIFVDLKSRNANIWMHIDDWRRRRIDRWLGETPLIAGRYTPEELDAVNPHTQWIRDAPLGETSE